MKPSFAILGLSTFCRRAATSLFKTGAAVLAIDQDERIVEQVKDDVSRAVCADVRDRDVLRTLGVPECDIVVLGLRHHFDITVLTVRFLVNQGVKNIIAQVDSLDEAEAIRAVGATRVVFPERDAADRLVKEMVLPGLVDQISLSDDIGVIEIVCPSEFAGKSIRDLGIREKFDITVIGIRSLKDERSGKIAPPLPQTVLTEDHQLLVVGRFEDVSKFSERFS